MEGLYDLLDEIKYGRWGDRMFLLFIFTVTIFLVGCIGFLALMALDMLTGGESRSAETTVHSKYYSPAGVMPVYASSGVIVFLPISEAWNVCATIQKSLACTAVEKKLYDSLQVGEQVLVEYRPGGITKAPLPYRIIKQGNH